jgi:hypothetical protein
VNQKLLAAIAAFAIALLVVGYASVGSGARPSPDVPPLALAPPGVAAMTPGGTDAQDTRGYLFASPDTHVNFGRLDPQTGKIVDGTYLLRIKLDLGDAPLKSASLPLWNPIDLTFLNLVVTKEKPRIEALATINDGPDGIAGGGFGWTFGDMTFAADPGQPVGAQGHVTLKIALVTNPREKFKDAPGLTAIIDTRIVDTPHPFLLFSQYHMLKVGGAN